MYHISKKKHFDVINIEQKNIKVSLLDYGATIQQIQTKNIFGEFQDILMAYQNIDDYVDNSIYLNATIGPLAGRIKNGLVKTDDQKYQFNKNQDNTHTLHSGNLSFAYKKFQYEVIDNLNETVVKMTYQTDAFKQINYKLEVTYKIYDGTCQIDYDIVCDHDFYFSLTNHAYFNLSGNLSDDITHHTVQINTDMYHELDDAQLSTGQILKDKLYDFTTAKSLNPSMIKLKNHPFKGYDDIYMFQPAKGIQLRAKIQEPKSKRQLSVLSDYDHMVFYTHNNVNNLSLKHLNQHPMHYGLCFECQKAPFGYPTNQIVKKNQHDKHTIIFKFDIVND